MPANAALVVAGDVEVAQVRKLAEKYYGAIAARPVPERKPRSEPEQAGVRRIDFKAPASQAYVSMAFKVPKSRRPIWRQRPAPRRRRLPPAATRWR